MAQNPESTPARLVLPPRSPTVRIVEVGPRDGLQNIPEHIPTATKLSFIRRLLATGLKTVELTSLVSPHAVPQLADCREVLSDAGIKDLLARKKTFHIENGPDSGLRLPVLVPNMIGLKNALSLGVREIAVFVSAGEGFSKANIGCSVQQGLERARSVAQTAITNGLTVRGYVSCIFADPFDGPTTQKSVLECVRKLLDMGCYEISLGDTLGVGVAPQVQSLIMYLVQSGIPAKVLAGHFHDTYGQAISNVWTAYNCGLRVFDASVAGLGGCPFAPGAKGNAATEDLVYLFHEAGLDTGIDISKLVKTGIWVSHVLKKPYGSRAGAALATKSELLRSPSALTPNKPVSQEVIAWSILNEIGEIKVYQSGSHVKVALDRPKNGNALTPDMCLQLTSFFQRASKDPTVRTITLTGNGKYFCTGMDLSKSGSSVSKGRSAGQTQFRRLVDLFDAIDNAPQITIACVQGPAFGGGVGLAFACDIRLMADTAVFTLSEVKLGLCPAIISKYLIRELGFSFSREAMLSGRPILPSELLRLGVVAGVQPDLKSLSSALEMYLLQLNGCAPRAAEMCKELVRLAWADAAGKEQAKGIGNLFTEMMAEDAEAEYGVKEFQAGQRSIDWARFNSKKIKMAKL
ncbi:aldolase [Pyrenochaeta sp. DS3sAY3a]|nr:aldolase [Pyrenochaeta sp. DS3sAY3a]